MLLNGKFSYTITGSTYNMAFFAKAIQYDSFHVVSYYIITASCPSGWSEQKTYCYKVMTDKTKWADANSRCEQHRAHLASIEDAAENKLISQLITSGRSCTCHCHLNGFKRWEVPTGALDSFSL